MSAVLRTFASWRPWSVQKLPISGAALVSEGSSRCFLSFIVKVSVPFDEHIPGLKTVADKSHHRLVPALSQITCAMGLAQYQLARVAPLVLDLVVLLQFHALVVCGLQLERQWLPVAGLGDVDGAAGGGLEEAGRGAVVALDAVRVVEVDPAVRLVVDIWGRYTTRVRNFPMKFSDREISGNRETLMYLSRNSNSSWKTLGGT